MNSKNDLAKYFVFAKILAKNMYLRSQLQRGHRASAVNDYADKYCNLIFSKIACSCSRWQYWHHVGVVIDFADICWNSRWLRRHGVSIANDYADTDKTTRTLSENFEGFSQLLREQKNIHSRSFFCIFGSLNWEQMAWDKAIERPPIYHVLSSAILYI